MKKIINNSENVVDEMVDGILKAHPQHLKPVKKSDRGIRGLVRTESPIKDKVAIATGGGSGHVPLFLGYVGEGLLDGVAIGEVFSSPSSQEMLEVTRAIAGGRGVLYLYGNYSGDVMNFDMASDMAEEKGIDVKTCLARDDVASAPKGNEEDRRGIAGILYAYKLAGAKAEEGGALDDVKAVADKAIENTRSMGIALSPCTIPETGDPTFDLGDDEMEIGMGIHGERGINRTQLQPSDEIVDQMLERLLEDLPFNSGDEVSVLVNGLGAIAPSELYIMYRRVDQFLEEKGIEIYNSYVGEYATSMEMKGASISLMRLDEESKRLLEKPAYSPFLLKQV